MVHIILVEIIVINKSKKKKKPALVECFNGSKKKKTVRKGQEPVRWGLQF